MSGVKEMKRVPSSVDGNDSSTRPCGLEGPVEKRMGDCSDTNSMVLVARTEDGKEVWKDMTTGLYWGDGLAEPVNQYMAARACKETLEEVAMIKGLKWRLPTMNEFFRLRHRLPNMDYNFWTEETTAYKQLFAIGARKSKDKEMGIYYDGAKEQRLQADRDEKMHIRCVASPALIKFTPWQY